MNLKINNISLIQSANIALKGLTVIGGENDTGKSTVGKLIFALVKAVSRYEEDLGELSGNKIFVFTKKLMFERDLNSKKNKVVDTLLSEAINDLIAFFVQNNLQQDRNLNSEESFLFQLKLDKLIESFKSEPSSQKYFQLLEEFRQSFFKKENKNVLIKKALRKALISEFYLELSPKHNQKSISNITIQDNDSDVLSINIANNEITSLELKDNTLNFNDVTFLETPILLQMHELINNADTLFDISDKRSRLNSLTRATTAFHIKDLMNKIIKARYFVELYADNDFPPADLMQKIETIIQGSFSFEENERDFIFSKKGNGVKKIGVKSVNTASGIKSFGMIQLLLQSGFIDNKSLVILDEPETHLHPKWQVEYARLIVELVKQGIPFLITSHSPYMIQALKRFSELGEIQDKTHFYLAEIAENKIQAHFADVSQNLNKLFLKLSEPLRLLL